MRDEQAAGDQHAAWATASVQATRVGLVPASASASVVRDPGDEQHAEHRPLDPAASR